MQQSEFIALKYGAPAQRGWSPRLRDRFGYLSPDDEYELEVARQVTPGTDWLDVGCGRHLFGSNMGLAAVLAARAKSLDGVDPSPNILENELLRHREQCFLEEYQPGRQDRPGDDAHGGRAYDRPAGCRGSVGPAAPPGWPGGDGMRSTAGRRSRCLSSPHADPAFHVAAKRVLWGGEDRDTFPTAYKMNTRPVLRRLFEAHGFSEELFRYLSDTRTLAQDRAGAWLELALWRGLRGLGLTYPENCLLGVYRRAGHGDHGLSVTPA